MISYGSCRLDAGREVRVNKSQTDREAGIQISHITMGREALNRKEV